MGSSEIGLSTPFQNPILAPAERVESQNPPFEPYPKTRNQQKHTENKKKPKTIENLQTPKTTNNTQNPKTIKNTQSSKEKDTSPEAAGFNTKSDSIKSKAKEVEAQKAKEVEAQKAKDNKNKENSSTPTNINTDKPQITLLRSRATIQDRIDSAHYNLQHDMLNRKADITFGQLITIVPTLASDITKKKKYWLIQLNLRKLE